MKKFSFALFLIIQISLFSQSEKPAEEEVKSVGKIDFKNRKGLASDSVKQTAEKIGQNLGKNSLTSKIGEEDSVKYQRIQPDKNKLGADVLSFGKNTKFGHINSIKRIISAYVREAYSYSDSSSLIIAEYIIFYNAKHRGDKKYFSAEKFQTDLSEILDSASTGISTNYKDWPGKTQIVIPLERNILQKDKKDLTIDELGHRNEKELREARTEKISRDKKEILAKEKELNEKDAIFAKKAEVISGKISELKKDPNADINEIRSFEKQMQEILKDREEISDEKYEIKAKKKELGIKDNKTNETSKQVTSSEPGNKSSIQVELEPVKDFYGRNKKTGSNSIDSEKLSLKKEETQNTADSLKDEKSRQNREKVEEELESIKKELEKKKEEEKRKLEFSESVVDGKIPFIKTVQYEGSNCNNEMHLLDPANDDFVFKGEFNHICGKNFKDFFGSLLVVGFKDNREELKLVTLSRKDLKIVGMSEASVSIKTPFEINEEHLYAIEADKGKFFISKFDKNLRRVMRSNVEIPMDSSIVFFGKKIYVYGKSENGQNAEVKVFQKEDLKFLKKLQS